MIGTGLWWHCKLYTGEKCYGSDRIPYPCPQGQTQRINQLSYLPHTPFDYAGLRKDTGTGSEILVRFQIDTGGRASMIKTDQLMHWPVFCVGYHMVWFTWIPYMNTGIRHIYSHAVQTTIQDRLINNKTQWTESSLNLLVCQGCSHTTACDHTQKRVSHKDITSDLQWSLTCMIKNDQVMH